MEILVELHKRTEKTTTSKIYIDGEFQCFSLEDNDDLVIAGKYSVKLRAEGGHHARYLKKFGADFHRGMLCVCNASNWRVIVGSIIRQYILIHIGNDKDDTEGCLLTGENVDTVDFIGRSKIAYMKLYEKVSKHLVSGGNVTIEYVR